MKRNNSTMNKSLFSGNRSSQKTLGSSKSKDKLSKGSEGGQ